MKIKLTVKELKEVEVITRTIWLAQKCEAESTARKMLDIANDMSTETSPLRIALYEFWEKKFEEYKEFLLLLGKIGVK